MANLTSTEIKGSDFDWDEIIVGDYNLDHSENFFAGSSSKMNALADALNYSQDINFDWNEMKAGDHNISPDADAFSNKENLGALNLMNKSQAKSQSANNDMKKTTLINVPQETEIQLEQKLASDFAQAPQAVDVKTEETQSNQESACYQDLAKVNGIELQLETELKLRLNLTTNSVEQVNGESQQNGDDDDDKSQLEYKISCMKSELLDERNTTKELQHESFNEEQKPRLRLNWTPKPVSRQEEPSVLGTKVPRAYVCKDVYQAKREMIMRQREEEERKAREFHSKPVPNFKLLHKRLADTLVSHKVTIPVTPETMKHSYTDMERRRRRGQESKLLQQEHELAKHARRAVLQDEKPFQLHADQRVRERREYNNAVQCNMAEKKKQVDDKTKSKPNITLVTS